ncbi:Pre-mRNA splicing factor-domain-containing protein [Myxozyma melibiosi]|uniref:Pre-mRNA-splicing factor CWC25 n=1 Tax=Myxozyma melibiosi TaxID=54550 RepID=A0ABR1F690_9ASCO
MAGDLNVKKSWHPGLMRNQEAVWKKEQEALDERKRIAERQREIQEERERAELQALQDGGRKRQERVEWMYNAPQGGNLGVSEEVEAFLMGKNTVEELLRQSESLGTLKEDEEQSFVASGSAAAGVNAKDVAAKVREDPMLVIKKEQQAVINALRNNPDRVAALKSSRSASDRERERGSRSHRDSDADRHTSTSRHSSSHRHRRDRSLSPRRESADSRRSSSGRDRDRHESSRKSSSTHEDSSSSHRHRHHHHHHRSSRDSDRYREREVRERDAVRVRD